MDEVVISREKFEEMQRAVVILRRVGIYKRLLEFEKNICSGERYTRGDLGF